MYVQYRVFMDSKLESSTFKRWIPTAIRYVLGDVNVRHLLSVVCKLRNYWRCKRRLFSRLRLQVYFTLEQTQRTIMYATVALL